MKTKSSRHGRRTRAKPQRILVPVDFSDSSARALQTYREGNQNKTTAVLKIPPVDSPQTAVKLAIASKARK